MERRGSLTAEEQVRRFYDEIWNRQDVSVVPEVLAPNVTFRGSLGPAKVGHDEFIDYLRYVTDALAGYRCDIETLVAEGDRVAVRMMFSGVHLATFLDVPPTGRRVSWAGAAFFTFTDGLVSDLWVLGDLHGLHAQLR
jgi:steroid delta-isomerase-like uncharacterized protein